MASLEEAQVLFDNNQGLAIHAVYSKYARLSSSDIEDLLQEAKVALWLAAKSYDPSRGTKFSSYALPYIIAAVASAARDTFNATVYYPKSIKSLASKLLKHYGTLDAITRSTTLYEDFSQYTKLSIDGAIQFLKGPVSLSSSNTEGEEFSLLDILEDPSHSSKIEDVIGEDLVRAVFEELSQEERSIMSRLMNGEDDKLASVSQQKIVKTKYKAYKLYLKFSGGEDVETTY